MARQIRRFGWSGVVVVAIAAVGAAWFVPWGSQSQVQGAVSLADATGRVLTVGPVRLKPGSAAESHLLLPAVQRAMARVYVVDGEGNILHTQDYQNTPTPGETPSPFFDVFFDISLTDTELVYSDSSVTGIIGKNDGGDQIIAVLIGLYLPMIQNVRMPIFRSDLGTMELHPIAVDPSDPSGNSTYLHYELENTMIVN